MGQKGAEADLKSSNPSEGALAFRQFAATLESVLEASEKVKYQKLLQSVQIISSQNYVDEESRRKALLRIQDMIQKEVCEEEKKPFYSEDFIAKIKMAFAMSGIANLSEKFIKYLYVRQHSFNCYTAGDFQGLLIQALEVSVEATPEVAKVANILAATFA
jgi:hypothetical protein